MYFMTTTTLFSFCRRNFRQLDYTKHKQAHFISRSFFTGGNVCIQRSDYANLYKFFFSRSLLWDIFGRIFRNNYSCISAPLFSSSSDMLIPLAWFISRQTKVSLLNVVFISQGQTSMQTKSYEEIRIFMVRYHKHYRYLIGN